MYNDPKYIVYNYQIYIFPVHINHADFAFLNRWKLDNIQGAGFINYGVEDFFCYGESVSMKIESRGVQDTRCAKKLFGID